MRDIKEILKPGANLKDVVIINFDDPKVKKLLEDCKKRQEAALKCKEVDWDRLSRMYITI